MIITQIKHKSTGAIVEITYDNGIKIRGEVIENPKNHRMVTIGDKVNLTHAHIPSRYEIIKYIH